MSGRCRIAAKQSISAPGLSGFLHADLAVMPSRSPRESFVQPYIAGRLCFGLPKPSVLDLECSRIRM
jgi:hypothetical protein